MARSKARRFEAERPDITMDDVAGSDHAKEDLKEIIDYLKAPSRYQSLGASIPKGVLMMGPPGTGKTLMAKAIAGEANVPFFSISGSEFIEMFVGVGAARVRDLFAKAKEEAPAIIFIDEIDSIGRSRGTGVGGGHDEREQTLNQILNEMDGFEKHQTVIVLAATNRPDVLDPALMRPGRFDRKITLDQPHKKAREAILRVHTRRIPLADNVDLSKLATRTIGFSGADLENLANEAALLAGRQRNQQVSMEHFDNARDKIVLGAEREGSLSETDKRVVAYHESGHALISALLPNTDPLDKVTILPRGRALGVTEQTPEEERYNVRYSYLRDRIAVMLGGRAAERLIFNETSTGAESDLEQATALARRMVSRWGMNKRLGPVAFRRGEDHVFLGREINQPPDFSEHTARMIDEEIVRLLGEIDEQVANLLQEHRAKLEALAQALLAHETLDAEAIQATLAKH
ncbi:ATP-dependent zinc metalloprotease FtsH [Alkalilimnicola ehrlichii]|uniref:ATP-dependent zinc metalloprotease FtsH n=1 Tax=Alkalilimnicola ehrlichii TaxID=351052 RepID=UPI0021637B3A|nr:ATP-dependent zinc metalloprotease FtsH [Alkalilimnicola ehrlichii]